MKYMIVRPNPKSQTDDPRKYKSSGMHLRRVFLAQKKNDGGFSNKCLTGRFSYFNTAGLLADAVFDGNGNITKLDVSSAYIIHPNGRGQIYMSIGKDDNAFNYPPPAKYEIVVTGANIDCEITAIDGFQVTGAGMASGQRMDTLHFTKVVKDVPTSASHHTDNIQSDYMFIFYLLLGINLLAIIPLLCKRVIGARKILIDYMYKTNDDREAIATANKHAQIHDKLLRTYLPAYLLATCADWLQGPYKYALYSSYGYTHEDIAHLFIAGYGSG